MPLPDLRSIDGLVAMPSSNARQVYGRRNTTTAWPAWTSQQSHRVAGVRTEHIVEYFPHPDRADPLSRQADQGSATDMCRGNERAFCTHTVQARTTPEMQMIHKALFPFWQLENCTAQRCAQSTKPAKRDSLNPEAFAILQCMVSRDCDAFIRVCNSLLQPMLQKPLLLQSAPT